MKCKHCGRPIRADFRFANLRYVHERDGMATCDLDRKDPRFMRVQAEPDDSLTKM